MGERRQDRRVGGERSMHGVRWQCCLTTLESRLGARRWSLVMLRVDSDVATRRWSLLCCAPKGDDVDVNTRSGCRGTRGYCRTRREAWRRCDSVTRRRAVCEWWLCDLVRWKSGLGEEKEWMTRGWLRVVTAAHEQMRNPITKKKLN